MAYGKYSNAAHGIEALFDARWYQASYPDLAIARCDALEHYLRYGSSQLRNPHPLFDTAWYLRSYGQFFAPSDNPLRHYLAKGWHRGYDPHPLFDSHWYLSQYSDVNARGINPLIHYLDFGAAEGRDPNPFFSSTWYLRNNPDVKAAGMNPLAHFAQFGFLEKRQPNPLFDLDAYLSRHPALCKTRVNPLTHFLRVGTSEGFALEVEPEVNGQSLEARAYSDWLNHHRWDSTAAASAYTAIKRLRQRPLISLVVVDGNLDAISIAQLLARLEDQIYPDWEVCLAGATADSAELKAVLKGPAQKMRPGIDIRQVTATGSLGRRLHSASALVRGDYVLVMGAGCQLHPAALTELALNLTCDGEEQPSLVYFDHDHCRTDRTRYAPAFKPDWSPELLLSYPYFGPVFCLQKAVFRSATRTLVDTNIEVAVLQELALSSTENHHRVAHIAQVLFHVDAPPAHSQSATALDATLQVTRTTLKRRRLRAKANRPSWAYRERIPATALRFDDQGPRVAIIIPTRNQLGVLQYLIDSLRWTQYRNYTVHVIDNESDDSATLDYLLQLKHEVIRIASPGGRFNFAYLINQAVQRVEADYVLFLNNDTAVISPNWLSTMVGYLGIPGVGVVGARLLFEDGSVQHAGVLLKSYHGKPGHAFAHLTSGELGYLYYAQLTRNYAAVTAACMLTPRRLFLETGGFDENRFAVAYNDVDYCLRLGEAGYRCVYCPQAKLVHHGSMSRSHSDDPAEEAAILARLPAQDRFYNQNLGDDGLFRPKPDAATWSFA
ncbi:MAG: hypothetical protein C1943_11480 [Halochromatium sp.]|nr:hypothetical protein [Halochromatium sp.]